MDLSSRIKETYYKKMKLKKQPSRAFEYGHNQSILISNFAFQTIPQLPTRQQEPLTFSHHQSIQAFERKMSKAPSKKPSKSISNPKAYQSYSLRKMSESKEKTNKDNRIIHSKNKKCHSQNKQYPKALKLEIVDFNPIAVQNLVFDPTRSNRKKDVKINGKIKRSIKSFSEPHNRKDFVAAVNRQFIPGQIMKMHKYTPKFMPWIRQEKTKKANEPNKTFYQRAHLSADRVKSMSRLTDPHKTLSKTMWDRIGGSISPWDQYYEM